MKSKKKSINYAASGNHKNSRIYVALARKVKKCKSQKSKKITIKFRKVQQ